MATDDRKSEQFIREVDEELRRAQLKAIWDRFAPLIIGVCVLVVVVTAGYRGWIWWQAREAAQAGDRYLAALENLNGENRALGEAELAKIAEEGGGYAPLARLRLAGEKAAAGQKAEAIAAYDSVSSDGSVSAPLRDVALIRAALLALDTGDLSGARERAAPLDESGNHWRHAAREVLGMVAYQGGELEQAREYFSTIQQDAETPPDLWVRSGMITALIDGQLAAPGAGGETAPAGAAPAQPTPAEHAPAELAIPEGEAPVMGPGSVGDIPIAEPASEPPVNAEPAQPAAAAPEQSPAEASGSSIAEPALSGVPASDGLPPASSAEPSGLTAPAAPRSTQNPPQ
ncbi:MAG TPA: tetratricopeptide repeat protein [Propylenella sp.]|nr:tetratricopeptide repeat protein [Propylenella sp.]